MLVELLRQPPANTRLVPALCHWWYCVDTLDWYRVDTRVPSVDRYDIRLARRDIRV